MADLKKIYVAIGPGDAHVLRGLLEVEGIDAVIRGDDMVPLQGGSLFHIETRPSVWVLDDDARPLRARGGDCRGVRRGPAGSRGVGGRRRLALPRLRRNHRGPVHGVLELRGGARVAVVTGPRPGDLSRQRDHVALEGDLLPPAR